MPLAAIFISIVASVSNGATLQNGGAENKGAPSDLITWRTCEGDRPKFSGHPAAISGIWFRYEGTYNEQVWEFWGDSMFRHTWIDSRVGAGVRASERGRFALKGRRLTLHITSETTSEVKPALADATLAAGGTRCKDDTREFSLELLGRRGAGGLVLNGVRFSLRSK